MMVCAIGRCVFEEKAARRLTWLLPVAIALTQFCLFASNGGNQGKKRDVEVRDAVQMVRIADPLYLLGGSSEGRVAHFSPDGKRFVVILTKGDLEQNTNCYSILLFETASAFNSPNPDPLLTMSSSSNRPAVKDLKWLADNETLIFIGESPGEHGQVFTLNVKTKHLEKLTDHPSSIVAFDTDEKGDEIIFEADPLPGKYSNADRALRQGIVVTKQPLNLLLAGGGQTFVPTFLEGEDVFTQLRGKPEMRIALEDVVAGSTALSLSPDGRYALIDAFVRNVPKLWEGYTDRLMHEYAIEQREKGAASILRKYILLDVRENRTIPLLDTPIDIYTGAFVWSPNGESVVLSGAYLPLNIEDGAELEHRKENPFVVEIRLSDRSLVKITEKRLTVSKWLPHPDRVLLDSGDSGPNAHREVYERIGSRWIATPQSTSPLLDTTSPLEISLKEDSNTPPRVFVTDREMGRTKLLLDLNPQFQGLRLGRVEDVVWTATDGHRVVGGLYLPPDFVSGIRYPLVIQTHGFNSQRFMIDGPWSSAFAAQPLAAKGFIVLQVGGPEDKKISHNIVETPREGPSQMAEFEGAIDFLTKRGLIDPSRVGIIGFSRTVYGVEYTLTHSKYGFAAATVADGINAGYFSYLVFPTTSDELLNGGPPFGDTLLAWLKNSPGFNLDKVNAAVRLESYGLSGGVLSEWEWFSGLSRLRKPVDLIYLPDAPHTLVKPWERMVSQQGNVDWFRFWLKGEEDNGQDKEDQYVRWHHLRDLAKSGLGRPGRSESTN